MGCDIHGYIEYEGWRDGEEIHYQCFGDNLGDRDYKMFGLLAGVRRDGCLFPPRGLPDNISFSVRSAYCLFVVDRETDGDRCVSKDKAKEYVSKYGSEWFDENYITDPDWHTPSWLTTAEYEQVLRAREEFKEEWGGIDQEWYAILAAMKVLKNARFVFWFDN